MNTQGKKTENRKQKLVRRLGVKSPSGCRRISDSKAVYQIRVTCSRTAPKRCYRIYSEEDIKGFIDADEMSPELDRKVTRLLNHGRRDS